MGGPWEVYPFRDSKIVRYLMTNDGYIVAVELPSPDFTGILRIIDNEMAYYIQGTWVNIKDYREYKKSLSFNEKIEKLLHD